MSIRRSILLCLCLFPVLCLQAQKINWAEQVGTHGGDEQVTAIASDPSKVILAGGTFTDTLPSTTDTAAGGKDIMLNLMNVSGSSIWSIPFQLETAGNLDALEAIHNNEAIGAYFITGQLDGEAHKFGGTASNNLYGKGSFFVARMNSSGSGSVNWIGPDTNESVSRGVGITSDITGDVYVLGEFKDSITLGTFTLYDTDGSGDLFIARYGGASGIVFWAQSIEANGSVEGLGIDYRSSNSRLIISGNFSNQLVMAPGDTLKADSVGQNDVFVARYQTTGTYVNSIKAIHSKHPVTGFGFDTDGLGNAVVTGEYEGDYTAGSSSESAKGGKDIFVVRVANNNTVDWAKTYGSTSDEGGRNVAIDANNNIYLLGEFENTVIFDSDTVNTNAKQDAWLATLNNTGTTLGAKGGIMLLGQDVMNTYALDVRDDTLWFGGDFFGNAKFGNAGTFKSKGFGEDGCLAQIEGPTVFCNVDTSITWSDFRSPPGGELYFCAGDSGNFSSAATGVTFQWFRSQGGGAPVAIAGATTAQYDAKDSGAYYLEFTDQTKNCKVQSSVYQVNIDTLPILNLVADTICLDNGPFGSQISPGLNSQPGTSLTGKGIVLGSTNYSPLQAGVGVDTVRYSYEELGTTCVSDTFVVFRVDSLPQAMITSSLVFDYCERDDADTLRWGTTADPQAIGSYAYTMTPSFGIQTDSVFRCDVLTGPSIAVEYRATDTNGCTSASLQAVQNINLYALPNVSFALNPSRACRNATPFNFSGGSPTGGLVSYYLGDGITDTAAGSYDPSQTPVGQKVDTIYYYHTTINNCTAYDSAFFVLDTVPLVTFSISSDTVCDDDAPIALITGEPKTGGNWAYSGNSYISNNVFYPQQAPPGKHEIIYTFTDFQGAGCTASDTDSVEVRVLPVVSMGSVGTICQNDTIHTINQGSPVGGYYQTQIGILINDRLDPSLFGNGDHDIWYYYEDSYKCGNRDTNKFTILEYKRIRFNSLFSSPLCEFDDPIDLQHLGDSMGLDPTPSAGGWYSLDRVTPITTLDPGAFIGPNDSLPVDTLIYYQFTNQNNCSSIDSQTVNIRPSPNVVIGSADEACAGIEHELEAFGGGNFLWSTGEITKSIRILQDTATTYSVTVTDFFGCKNSDDIFVRMSNGIFIVARKDSVTLQKGGNVTRDPLAIYPADTLALIGIYETKNTPSNASLFEPQFGIDPRFESEYYYEPDPEFRRIDSVEYKICNITCPNLCDSNYVIFHVFGDPYEFIPGGFSPNGDGLNDTWVIPGIEAFTSNELYIYNRWGDLIYSANPYNNEWEGQTNSGILGGEKVGDGTYFYVLITNGGEPLQGTIELKSR